MIELSLLFGTFALSVALTESEGAWGSLKWLRNKTVNFGLLQCFLCTSAWTSVALCIAFGRLDMILIAWGACVLVERLINAYMVR